MNLNKEQELCSFNGTMHDSFDHAQQVHFPSNPSRSILRPVKCGIFAVMCKVIPCQVNYLIDEAATVGKVTMLQ